MYEKHWKLDRKPFENSPDPEFLYYSDQHEEALMRLLYAVRERKGAAILTGEYGSGKTTISRALVEKLRNDDLYEVVLIPNPSLSANEFIAEILHQLNAGEIPSKKVAMLQKLEEVLYRNLNNKRETVIIIDEAQCIKRKDTLEELRLLLNFQMNDRFLLTLILVGQPEVKEKINQVKQFKQRLAVRFNLKLLEEKDTRKYIDYRLKIAGRDEPVFSNEAVHLIHTYAKGAPRDINNICDMSLLMGYVKKADLVSDSIAKEVIEDLVSDFE